MNETVLIRESSTSENYIREIIFTLSVQKKLIFSIASVVFLIVIGIVLFFPEKYTTTAKIMVSRKPVEGSISSLENIDYKVEAVSQDDLNSEAQLLTSNDLLEKVIRKLHNEGSAFMDNEPGYQENKQKWLEEQVDKLKSVITVDVIPYSRVLEIFLTSDSADRVQLILKTIIDSYLDYRIALDQPERQANFFVQLTDQYADRLQSGQKKLSELVLQRNATSPDEEIKSNIEIEFNLKKLLSDVELKEIEIGQKIEVIKKHINSGELQFFSFIENETISQFSKRIQELIMKRAETAGIYTPDSKALQSMGQQIEEAYQKLLVEVKTVVADLESQHEGLNLQIKNLNDKINDISVRNKELKQLQLAMGTIEKENNMLEMSFETFFKRKEEANLSSDKTVSNTEVVILSSPRKPLSPSFPTPVMVPFGFFLALGIGIIIGFLNEFFDHSFKRPDDIERVLGVSHLMSINDV